MRRAILLATILGFAAPVAQAAEVDPAAFRPYAASLLDRLVIATEQLAQEVEAGDLEQSKQAWIAARVGWERGETFLGEYFPDADEAIDTWPDASSGFHAVEPILFEQGDIEAAKPLAAKLIADVRGLKEAFAKQEFDAQGLVNGIAGIAFEIGDAKVDGGESPFAGTSLQDMQNNMAGIEALYALSFAPVLEARDPALHERIVGDMIDLAAQLDQPAIGAMDRSRVMALSEQLAGDFQEAAAALGLEQPLLGG
jgi:iron uptake system component EfeO